MEALALFCFECNESVNRIQNPFFVCPFVFVCVLICPFYIYSSYASSVGGSFVVKAMQTLFAAEIREFSGSWADPAFVGLTLIYDQRERQMFRRSDEKEEKDEHFSKAKKKTRKLFFV